MTDNQFDEFFKNKLGKYASGVPDDMWQRINKKDKDRKGFFIPRWYWLVLLLLFFGVGGYFILNNNANEKPENNLAKTENATGKKTNEKKSSEEIFDKEGKKGDSIVINNSENETTKTIDKSNIKKANGNKINNQTSSVNSNTTISSSQVFANNDDPGKRQPDNSNDITIDKNVTYSSNTKKVITKISGKDSSATDDDSTNPKNEDEDNLDKFSIELYASPVFALNSIHADNSSYEQVLKDASKMQLSYSFGARFDVKITKKLSAKIGVQYTQVNEKMNFKSDSIFIETVSNNRYKSIAIPLLFSYTSNLSQGLKASVTSGILLNLFSKYKGSIPYAYGGFVSFSHDSLYNHNASVSIYLGLELSKEINKKMDVFAQPYFLYRTKNMVYDMQPFTQKIHTAGIELGLRYRLFKKED